MARQLKRWESPRKEGRNDKGRGGSARQRQLKKKTQALRQKLKDQPDSSNSQSQNNPNKNPKKKGEKSILSLLLFKGMDGQCNCIYRLAFPSVCLRLHRNSSAYLIDSSKLTHQIA
jgi:hypothetical protein